MINFIQQLNMSLENIFIIVGFCTIIWGIERMLIRNYQVYKFHMNVLNAINYDVDRYWKPVIYDDINDLTEEEIQHIIDIMQVSMDNMDKLWREGGIDDWNAMLFSIKPLIPSNFIHNKEVLKVVEDNWDKI